MWLLRANSLEKLFRRVQTPAFKGEPIFYRLCHLLRFPMLSEADLGRNKPRFNRNYTVMQVVWLGFG